jgi:hypothetical protein
MARDRLTTGSSSGTWTVSRTLRLGLILVLISLVGCVSRVGPSSEEERLAGLLAQLPPQEPLVTGERQKPPMADDYYLHIAGLVECGGFLRKTQTSYAEVWATRPGKEGPRVELNEIELRINYLDGLFEGVLVMREVEKAELLRSSDVARGNFSSSPCGCVRFVAEGKIPPRNDKIVTRLKVCPSP